MFNILTLEFLSFVYYMWQYTCICLVFICSFLSLISICSLYSCLYMFFSLSLCHTLSDLHSSFSLSCIESRWKENPLHPSSTTQSLLLLRWPRYSPFFLFFPSLFVFSCLFLIQHCYFSFVFFTKAPSLPKTNEHCLSLWFHVAMLFLFCVRVFWLLFFLSKLILKSHACFCAMYLLYVLFCTQASFYLERSVLCPCCSVHRFQAVLQRPGSCRHNQY